MTKLIKNWQELAQVPPSDTHYLDIIPEDGNGWIIPLHTENDTHGLRNDYLSTHTFYGSQHKNSTARLQACGFDVELDNWDNPTQTNRGNKQ